jgi:hypothetical protein
MTIVKALYDNRKKGSIDGSVKVEYNLSKTCAGKLGYGRLYGTRGSLETLEREIRGTICEEFYHDIDVKNCHPVILVQFAKRYCNTDLPEVAKYCDNRDEYLKRISDNRDEAKQAVIKIMYGGKTDNDFLKPFEKEVYEFTRRLSQKEHYKPLLDYLRKQDGNVYGQFLSFVMQTEERGIMLSMKKSLESQGWSVDVLAYDGVMIRKQKDVEFNTDSLREVEDAVLKDTGYAIELADKAFDSYEMPVVEEEVAPKVSKELYRKHKAEFEENHFYYAPTNTIAELNHKGHLAFYTLDHAATLYHEFDFKHSAALDDRTGFLKLWLLDDKRRTHWEIDQKPSDDPRVYSPPVILKHTEGKPSEDANILETFKQLVLLAAGEDENKAVYITAWLAHILQKPFENPGTAVILTGRQGCGKDTLGDFFSEWIIGRNYSHNYTSTEQFWDKHDTERMGKFFVKIEEASGFLNRQHIGQMKATITSHTLTVNPKGVKAITTGNYNRLFMTTNEGSPVKMEGGDRRWVISDCSPRRIGDFAYWTALRKCLFNADAGATVAKFLMGCDLSKFDPKVLPVSAFAAEMADADKTAEDQFLDEWDGVELTAALFFEKYREYCINEDLRYAANKQLLGLKLLTALRDKRLVKHRKADGVYYSK